ncbi:hypothetical protein GC163_21940 [bacterium]|nr:hypothetical protein [bacterium]
MSFLRRMLCLVVGIELIVALGFAAWRMTRSAPPELHLSRLPPLTAEALQSLRAHVWNDRGETWQELGEACLAFGYCAEAEVCLRQAVARLPARYSTRYMHACSLERLSRWEEANQQFQSAIALGSRQQLQTCQSQIGRNCLRLGDLPGAEAAWAACPDMPGAQVERARLLARTGRSEAALSILGPLREDSALDVRTEMVAVQVFLELGRSGDAMQAAERADRAVSHYRIANPQDILEPIRSRYGLNAILGRGAELDRTNQPIATAAVFEEVFQSTPVEFLEMVLPTGARLDLQNHHPEAALAKYEILSQRMDIHPEVRLVWGGALEEAGQLDLALEQWQRASAAQPTAMLHQLLASGLGAQGDEDAARQEQFAARLQQAVDLYRTNQLAVALSQLNELSRELPEESRVFFYRGLVHSALGQRSAADADFQQCLKIDPLNGKARERLVDE